jgi:cell division protein FtsB
VDDGVGLDNRQGTEGFSAGQIFQSIWDIFYGARRQLATAGVGVLVLWLGFHVIFGANGMVVYQNKKAEYKKLQVEMQQVEEENKQLTKQVDELRNDPKAIEREAREQLHYSRKGELVFLLPGQKQTEKPTADASADLKK